MYLQVIFWKMFEHFVVPTEPWINRGSTVEQLLFAVESLLFAVEQLLFAVDWAPPQKITKFIQIWIMLPVALFGVNSCYLPVAAGATPSMDSSDIDHDHSFLIRSYIYIYDQSIGLYIYTLVPTWFVA